MKKTDYIANISCANGTHSVTRRVWEDDQGAMFIKIEGTYRRVRHCKFSGEFICNLVYKP